MKTSVKLLFILMLIGWVLRFPSAAKAGGPQWSCKQPFSACQSACEAPMGQCTEYCQQNNQETTYYIQTYVPVGNDQPQVYDSDVEQYYYTDNTCVNNCVANLNDCISSCLSQYCTSTK